MKTTATLEQLQQALDHVNTLYAGNVVFKDTKQLSPKRVQFTLTVKASKAPGSRRSPGGRRISAACWHVHGHFFDSLWSLNPSALILAGTLRMTGKQDNWQDRNIGSQYRPCYFSEACDCGKE